MDISWFTELKLFDIPFMRFVFHEHLPETLTILGVVIGLGFSFTKYLSNIIRNRRIPLGLSEKLFEATEIYIKPDYGLSDYGLFLSLAR